MTIDDLRELVSVQAVQDSLDEQIWETLTYDASHKPQQAIDAACGWVFSRLVAGNANNRVFSADELELLRLALLKRSAYELYTMSEVEGSADDKKRDAYTYINGLLGLAGSDEEQQQPKKRSLISVSKRDAPRVFNPFNY